jgi:hypothetical protein
MVVFPELNVVVFLMPPVWPASFFPVVSGRENLSQPETEVRIDSLKDDNRSFSAGPVMLTWQQIVPVPA